jgi:DNA polymerase I-like protein with 3'-5' exonuclease and polymerase domains|tara:strand:+ start:23 stop:592 length:570 start_codon:yes stop_codon:yes gene_type:complete
MTLDVETTHKEKKNGGYTPLPYFGNKLVSVGYKYMDSFTNYLCFSHADKKPDHNGFQILQDALDNVDVLIGHNIKFDISWLRDCGFVFNNHLYDTMVAEYILASARRWPLGLKAVAEKYGTEKKKDLVDDYMKKGITFYDIPWDIIEEYGIADVEATERVALAQLEAFGTTFEELYNEPTTFAHTATVT